MQINRVAVIGGGTAGWLAANYLGEALSSIDSASVTLIESPDIPTIGVGEGTVPAMRETLKRFGVSETHFIRECDVSFKQSIKFINWLDQNKHGKNNAYHHLFDFPFPFGDDLAPFWLADKQDRCFSDIVSVQGKICDAGLAPKRITNREYEGEATYAYHLNAAKFAKMLNAHACEHLSVEHIYANVLDVNLAEDGFIDSIVTDSKGTLNFDFYIDCTGFSSYFLGQKFEIPFIDKSKQLFVDTALVKQVPTDPGSDIPPYTIATAHQAGWVWDIALPARRGVGFVYSSRHMDDDDARKKFSRYLGDQVDGDFRKIPMQVGHREKFWSKNCVAIGLSQGFIEPLEATAILLADYSAKLLTDKFPRTKSEIEMLETRYNKVLTYSWERVFDFIKLHYCISDRSDSSFWKDNRDPDTISDSLLALLEMWKTYSPKVDDFFSKFEVFDVENYLYVLYGMKYPTKINKLSSAYMAQAQRQYDEVVKQSDRLQSVLPKHRDLLEKIIKHGLQKI